MIIMSNMEKYYCLCDVTKMFICYEIDHDTKSARMGEMNLIFTPANIKAILSIINNSIKQLKSKGIVFLEQYVNLNDYNNYLKHNTTWKIIENNDDKLLIKCCIDDAVKNISIGMDIL